MDNVPEIPQPTVAFDGVEYDLVFSLGAAAELEEGGWSCDKLGPAILEWFNHPGPENQALPGRVSIALLGRCLTAMLRHSGLPFPVERALSKLPVSELHQLARKIDNAMALATGTRKLAPPAEPKTEPAKSKLVVQ